MVDFFIGLFMATLISAIFTTRLYRLFFWYGFNSLFLGLVAVVTAIDLADRAMLVSGILTIGFKALLLPLVLKHLSAKFALQRTIMANIKTPIAILLVPAIIVFTYYLCEPILHLVSINQNYIAIAIASMFLALLLMLEHTNVAPKIVGFLMMENALFLLGVTATEGMPMLVELGIFFDLLMAIVVVNLLLKAEHA